MRLVKPRTTVRARSVVVDGTGVAVFVLMVWGHIVYSSVSVHGTPPLRGPPDYLNEVVVPHALGFHTN